MSTPAPLSSPHPLDRLVADQHVVLSLLERTHECGVNTAVGLSLMATLRRPLTAYLVIGDRLIYPRLRDLARFDRPLHELVCESDEYGTVTAQAQAFFEAHGDRPVEGFLRDWGQLYMGVRRRLRLERQTLFPALRASTLANDLVLPAPDARRPGRSGVVAKGHADAAPPSSNPPAVTDESEDSMIRPLADPGVVHIMGPRVVDEPDQGLESGTVVGERYRIHERLASGGMGRIYRAEQVSLGRYVALKVLDPKLTRQHPGFRKRFFIEAATCAKITHPNVVTVHDYGLLGPESDSYFMAMELVEGEGLHRMLRREGPLPWKRAVHLAYELARALRAAHRIGAVHQDLKPSNIMLVRTDEGESVKVLDFGLVRILGATPPRIGAEEILMGSSYYIAPEQIRMQEVDGRADIYALGVILYRMLTGRVPFKGPTDVDTLRAHLRDRPPALPDELREQLPKRLETVVLACLRKDPGERWNNANELLGALRSIREA